MRSLKIAAITAVAALGLTASGASADIFLNEIRIDQAGTDADEYFELFGNPSESLSGLTFVVLGDGTGGSGVVERAFDLSGAGSIPADGYFLAAGAADMPGFTGESVDLVLSPATNILENSDTLTFLLVNGWSGTIGTDLDTNDDGVLDSTPWSAILDSLAVLDDASELPYSATQIGPNGTFPPSAVSRFENGTGDWRFDVNGQDSFALDTPGVANTAVPEPASLALAGLGGLALLRRRRA